MIICHLFANDKHIIETRPDDGLFTALIRALNNIMWADQHNKTPVVLWTDDWCYAQKEGYNGSLNPWEYYFEPAFPSLTEEERSAERPMVWLPDFINIIDVFRHKRNYFDREFRSIVKTTAIDKYVKIKPVILNKIDSFYEKNMKGKKNIAIHLRGTDRKLEVEDYLDILHAAQCVANQFSDNVQFFVATDEENLLDLAQSFLDHPVISCDFHRSRDESPIHLPNALNQKPGALIGEEALIDALLLSKCDFFVHAFSFLSVAVLVFNPSLPYEYIPTPAYARRARAYKIDPKGIP